MAREKGMMQSHKFIQPLENWLALLPKIVVRDSAVDALFMAQT
jgi:hypothetical protein